MLYTTKQKEAYYYVAQPVGEVFYDLYNLSSMTRTEEALQLIIKWHLDLFQLSGAKVNSTDKYTLTLDFLANMKTEHIAAVIEKVIAYFSDQNYNPIVNEEPLHVTVTNLKIEDVLRFIQDNNFQSLNNAVSSLHCSTWRLTID